MKKTRLLFLTLMLACCAMAHADGLTPAQKAFQSTLMSFLREEGFSPYIDDDNSLNFKKEGDLFWITIAEDSPFYVEFHKSGLKCEDANKAYVLLACNKSNLQTKCAKSIMKDKSISIVIEMYCHSAEEFKYIFYKSMKELDNAEARTKKFYNEYDENNDTPFTITKVEVANTDENNNLISSWDNSIYDFETKYLQPRITVDVKTAGTYDLYVKLIAPTGLSTSSNSPSGYSYKTTVEMEAGTNTYRLSGWGTKNAGNWEMGDYRFEIYYDGSMVAKREFRVR